MSSSILFLRSPIEFSALHEAINDYSVNENLSISYQSSYLKLVPVQLWLETSFYNYIFKLVAQFALWRSVTKMQSNWLWMHCYGAVSGAQFA